MSFLQGRQQAGGHLGRSHQHWEMNKDGFARVSLFVSILFGRPATTFLFSTMNEREQKQGN